MLHFLVPLEGAIWQIEAAAKGSWGLVARRKIDGVATIALVLSLAMLACQRNSRVEVLIAASKPYDEVIAQVHAMNGVVHHEYQNIDAISATIPATALSAFEAMSSVGAVAKDRRIHLSELRGDLEAAGAEYSYTIDPSAPSGDVVPVSAADLAGYFPTETDLMNASEFWSATGHVGEGVVVGIVDSGTADVVAIRGRVVGGESFLSAFPPLEDGLSATNRRNDPHGTWVATTLGAAAVFGFPSSSAIVQALEAYIPEAVLHDFFAPGVDGSTAR